MRGPDQESDRRLVAGAPEDLLDDGGLCVGVVLGVPPRPLREVAFRRLVAKPVGFVASQVIAEEHEAFDLLAARREDVEVDVRIRAAEEAMLVPVGFSDAEHIAGGLERRHVRRLVARIGDGEDDVDPAAWRRAAAPRSSRRAPAAGPGHPASCECAPTRARRQRRPSRVVLDQGDRCVERLERPDAHRGKLLVASQGRLVHSETLGPRVTRDREMSRECRGCRRRSARSADSGRAHGRAESGRRPRSARPIRPARAPPAPRRTCGLPGTPSTE